MKVLAAIYYVTASVSALILILHALRKPLFKFAHTIKSHFQGAGDRPAGTNAQASALPVGRHRELTGWEEWITLFVSLIGTGLFVWAAFSFKPGSEAGIRLTVLGLILQGIPIVYRRIAENPSSERIRETFFIVAFVSLVGLMVALPLMTRMSRDSDYSKSSFNATYKLLEGTTKIETGQLGTMKALGGWLKRMGSGQNYLQQQVFDIRTEIGKEQTQIKRLQDEMKRLRSNDSESSHEAALPTRRVKAPHSSTTRS